MGKALKCDRCDKYYEYYNHGENDDGPNGFQLIERNRGDNFYSLTKFDLCPECLKDFEFWINKKENKINFNKSEKENKINLNKSEKSN